MAGGVHGLTKTEEMALLKYFGFDRKPEPRHAANDIEIPQVMLEAYKKQTGQDADTTNFRKPGALTGSANHMAYQRGRVIQTSKGKLSTEAVVDFPEFFQGAGNDLQAAYLMVSTS